MPIKLSVNKQQIIDCLVKNNNDIKQTAIELNISVPTIYRYIKQTNNREVNKLMINETVDVSLSAYVPTKEDYEIMDYKPRQPYLNSLTVYLANKRPVLLIGEAGTGKTSLARYYAHTQSLPFLEISCDGLLGFRELLGQINITDGTSHFIEGLFTKFIQVPSVVLLDEITALDPGKNFMLHQLLQTREFFIKEANRGLGQTYKLHPECKLILACNPPSGKYPGTNRMNVALVDRPQVLWMDELTIEEVKRIVPNHTEKEKLLFFYKEVKAIIEKNGYRTTFSIRSLKKTIDALTLGFELNQALHDGFLNGVKATAGDEAYKVMVGIAKTVWKI